MCSLVIFVPACAVYRCEKHDNINEKVQQFLMQFNITLTPEDGQIDRNMLCGRHDL
jgi:hypothetical protein